MHSNVVYNDYIADKQHVHMNATKWHSLAEFVYYLQRKGVCECEETPKGILIKYVERDPEALKRQVSPP